MRAAPVSLIGLTMLACAARAEAQSARTEFERQGLLGTYSGDCASPVSAQNGYVVYRALDATRVQRDTMSGPTTRLYLSIADTAELKGQDLLVTGTTGDKPLRYTLRIDKGPRLRVMAWIEDGVTSVTNGIWTERKYTMPWLAKCD